MSAKTKSKEQTGVFIRGAKEFRHDLFKSDVQLMKRNTSFQAGVLKIMEIEHAHIYHSHNSQGRVQEYTSTVGGHFHPIERGFTKDGTPFIKCGPAMREAYKRSKRGGKSRKVKENVQFEGEDKDGREVLVVDKHVHTFEYEGSEVLSDRKVKQMQAKTQAAVADALPEMEAVLNDAANDADPNITIEEGDGD